MPVEQAVTTEVFGPIKPCLIDTSPEIILTIDPGTKNGETFLYPLSSNKVLFFSIVSIPPMPAPKLTPTFVKSRSDSSIPEFSMD